MNRALTIIQITVLGAVAALTLAATAAASPPTLWSVPAGESLEGGHGAGELDSPRAVAVDPASGDLYVTESENQSETNGRIDEFTAWGVFVKAFGWSVNAADPAEELQVCTAQTGCRAGTEGEGRGQLTRLVSGIAIGEDGRIYVAEPYRVQAFEPDGSFAFMFGGQVNKSAVDESATRSAEENLCPAPGHPGDVCQAGVSGNGPGEFSNSGIGNYNPHDSIATGPEGTIYVGDVGRIEKFDPAGNFLGEIEGVALAGRKVQALDVDAAGAFYVVALETEPGEVIPQPTSTVQKLGPAGEVLMSFEAPESVFEKRLSLEAVAVGEGENLYVVGDRPGTFTPSSEPRIIEFDRAGNVLIPSETEDQTEEQVGEQQGIPPEPFLFGQVHGFAIDFRIWGVATSTACGIIGEDIYASYQTNAPSLLRAETLLRAYGPHPDPALCPPPAAAPSIEDTYAASVGPDAATVQAKINPHFWGGTTYYVQYGVGKCSEAGCDREVPTPPGSELDSEAGAGVKAPGIFLGGLAPGTTYHYRFVAQSPGGGPTVGPEETFATPPPSLSTTSNCSNQVFRIGLSAKLPDCRAYEMVSPVDKEGADVVAVNTVSTEVPARLDQSAASGEKLTYSAYRAFAGAHAAPFSSQYLSSRGAGGWTTEPISPPRGNPLESAEETGDTEYQAFSSDLCQGWLRLGFEADPQLDPAEVKGFPNLYRREGCAPGVGSYQAISTVAPPHLTAAQTQHFNPEVQGFSAKGQCVVFRAPDTLTADAPLLKNVESEKLLYENCGGVLRLVAILPDGSPSQSSSTAGTGNKAEGVPQFQQRGAGVYRAVSEDGTKIYWTANGEHLDAIYLRMNADQSQSAIESGKCTEPAKACTLPVSGLVSGKGARFWTASADGTRAIFSIGDKAYEYTAANPAKPKATLIAEGVNPERLGMLGASTDASRIYFASEAVLAPGASSGRANLYFRERGESPRFLGVLHPSDLVNASGGNLESLAISFQPGFRAARVSADGLYAAFMSSAPLTGFNSTDQRNGEPDREVFLYDARAEGGAGRLDCVSCDPSGARPVGQNIENNAAVPPLWATARIPTWPSALYAANALVTEGAGARLFFDSFVPLALRDTNGKADVYEWESAEGQAACEEAGAERYVASSHGCLSLISSGNSPQDSEFIDADPSGRNVFFATGQSLLSQDPGLIDIYDAREGGGFPPPPVRPAACEGEACQSPPEPPNDPTPASSAFVGAGNVHQAKPRKSRCAKGKIRRKGHCVKKRHSRKGHSHKRSHHR